MSHDLTDVVFTFSTDTYDDAVNRQFCRTTERALTSLVQDPRTGQVLVVDPWRSHASRLRRRTRHDPASLRESGDSRGPVRRLTPHRTARTDPTGVAELRQAYRSYDARISASVRRHTLGSPVLVTFHPFVAAYCPATWASQVIYYAQDDWSAYPPMREWSAAFRDAYARIRDRGCAVVAVSEELRTRLAPQGPSEVIPNGIDETLWLQPPPPEEAIESLPGPVGIYTGSVDDRLDLDAVRQLLAAGAIGRLVVVGPVLDAEVGQFLEELPGVLLTGAVDQRRLASILRACDVALLPHVVTPLTQAMSPLKLFEYLAAGLRVVATDLPPVRGISDTVQIVTSQPWPEAVSAALARPPSSEDRRREMVHELSWTRRLRPFGELVHGGSHT